MTTIKPVTDTGIRGFLKWFQQVQPGIYKQIAPQLPTKVPTAFGQYEAGGWRVAGLSRDEAVNKLNKLYKSKKLSDFDDDDFDVDSTDITGGDMLDPITVNAVYTGGDTGAVTTNYGSSITPLTTALDVPTAPVAVDVATAANSGPTSTSIVSAVGSLISAASNILLNNNAAKLQQQVVQTQLARAQAGLAPLTTSLNSLGVPTVTVGSTGMSSGMLLLLAAGVGAALFLSSGSSSKSK
jgi:hypothetical protein